MRIAMLLSGGVDSAVGLALLKKEGHDITAFYIKIWLEDEFQSLGQCPWEGDLAYCRAVCDMLGVPLRVVSLQQEYWDLVVQDMLSDVKEGRTPNPDVLCNERIKFGAFYDTIDPSFDKVATGHYAGVEGKDGVFRLLRAPDPVKDQTYFLATLTQPRLSRALFPIGHLLKKDVRRLAAEMSLPNKDRKDSQGICFLGKIDYDAFLRQHLGEQEGAFIDANTGTRVGRHDGHWFYTAGQRHGIDVGKGPWYVVSKDAAVNAVFISNTYKKTDAPRDRCVVSSPRWIATAPDFSRPLLVKMRHGPTLYPCTVTDLGDGRLEVRIKGNDQGMAPGQYVVFYDEKECHGAGVIE